MQKRGVVVEISNRPIAVLLLGAWGIIQLAVAIPSLFSNFGGGFSSFINNGSKTETLTVSSISNLTSGQTLQVSWDHKNKDGEYSYALSYACQTGLSVKALLPTGAYQTVACNTSFNFVSATERTTIVPTATKSLPLVITVTATKLSSGVVTAQGNTTTTVAPAAATTPAKPTTSTSNDTSATYVPAASTQNLYGYGDLAVQIGSVTPTGNGLTAVKFTVTNIGTNSVAGGWMFNANLPINGSYVYSSAPQRALFPGDKIVYTLTYSNSNSYYTGGNNYNGYNSYDPNGWSYTGQGNYNGQGTYNCNGYVPCYPQPTYNYGYNPVTIIVDPTNVVWESNEYNNTAQTQGY